MQRWTEADANAWWAARPWVCGFNFLPSTAVNFLEMWHADTFDRDTIERELGWASEIGFNAFRVNLPYLVWKHDRDGLMERFEWVVGVAHRVGIDTVPCFFDDCGFGGFEPEYGPQPEPVPGLHNSRAVASPGRALLLDGSEWDGFEAYVRDFVRGFRGDSRILFWDLYNEPGNRLIFTLTGAHVYEPDFTDASLRLMQESFDWCRSEEPEQPASVGVWTTPPRDSDERPYQTEIEHSALRLSDVVTFHAYWDTERVREFVDELAALNRPMLCTEWMARPVGSRIADQLGLFHSRGVGCFQWGLVQGRTQTYHPWPKDLLEAISVEASRSVWFHDLLKADGAAYDPSETARIRELTAAS